MASITLEIAQAILDVHVSPSSPIVAIHHFGAVATSTFLLHTTSPATASYLVSLVETPAATDQSFNENSISAQYSLLTHLHTHLPLPHPLPLPSPLALTPTYLLLRLPHALSPTPELPITPAQNKAALLGASLRAVHACAGEWFGRHAWEHEGVYSWQEAFTRLLEDALDAAPPHLGLDVQAVRKRLSRAIGFFLFDDVEEPAFVALTSEAVYARADAPDGDVVLWLPTLPHALFGDPLLERVFSEVPFPLGSGQPAPSRELLQGYGSPLIVFARQRTKRLWYDLYLGLLLLLNESLHSPEELDWARELVRRSAELLENAPCY
ncbi:hypothetical protein BV25DRAFT_1736766 [Artomyces pyxidatus]|uniref:Uncharacterized protein n=1 Tax=Artomyces pyxidatus TaxID=48021 RepID=A0ACB8SHA7_9AGAM|nr:hypothetical protein BV25DRAFT_1736766 [Artomyces pyxidatus]